MTAPTIDLRWDPDGSSVPWAIEPGPDAPGAIDGESVLDLRARTRAELGLDPDRPVIVVGHQPEPWHPGILAKFMVGDLLASRHEAQLVHLVVDAHRGDWNRMEWPCGDDAETLEAGTWSYLDADAGRTMRSQPAMRPQPVPDGPAMPGILEGMRRWHAALDAEHDASSAAAQCAGALDRLMDPWVGPRTTIMVSELLDSSIGTAVLAAMRSEPSACVAAFNQAVDRHPTLGVRRLDAGANGLELPLWVEHEGGLRTATNAELDAGTLHPKALVLTALARVGLADLFIHGLGGWRYDVAMEEWMSDWLGVRPGRRAMATADLRLPLLAPDRLESLRNALLQGARRRRHDPETASAVGGPGPSKARALAEIESLPRGSFERQVAWSRMHDWIERQVVQDDGGDAAMHRIESLLSMAMRRTWAFPLHEPDGLHALKAAIESSLP